MLTDKHSAQKENLIWKNFYYGRRKKRLVYFSTVESFSQPAHFMHPEMFDLLSEKVEFYKELREHFAKQNNASKANALNPPSSAQ